MSDWLVGVAAFLSTLVGVGDEDVECLRLGALDAVRVEALTSGRPDLLEDVYGTGQATRRDRSLLSDYGARGLTLRGAALERLECRLVRGDGAQVVLRVVDRLGPTWVVDETGRRRELPRGAAKERVVTLLKTPDGWRVSASR